ncbi:MAG: peptidase [Acidobacteriota bacterium]
MVHPSRPVRSAVSPLILALLFALLVSPAWGKKAPETHGHEHAAFSAEASETRGTARYSLETGAALHLSNLRYRVPQAAPETMARRFLNDHHEVLGLRFADTRDLTLHAVREGLSGTTVRLRQHADGIPVHQAELVVTFNRQGQARTVASTYRPQVESLATRQPIVGVAEAEALALDRLAAVADTLDVDTSTVELDSTLQVLVLDGQPHLAHRVVSLGESAVDGWEYHVDAFDGRLLRAADTKLYIDGSGDVFEPDPLSSAGTSYGDSGYTDNNDGDTPELVAEIQTVTLRDITETGGMFFLTGPWAEVVDHDNPFKGLFEQATANWNFTRVDDAFEAANTYHHIDLYMRYLNVTLGLNIRPTQYSTGVRFDPSGWSGADNSSYSPGTGRLSFGEGGVDDAEDADVIIHELGHGLHDWVTAGGLSQVEGLSEGIGDYAAVSYSRSFNQWTPADPQWDWMFSWDGHNEFWGGRVTNWNDIRDYPDDLGGSIHQNGQFWASCNIDILEQIGIARADTAHWEGIARTGSGTNQQDAAQAVLDAAADLGYSVAEVTTMVSVYQGCGYTVIAPDLGTIFVDGFESGDTTAWSSGG